ncbi:MAG: NAD-dependent epimerase/dehydratase family protein [Deltaproteobacteria bacterium]|nr:NAD-dependent epimerase/dehydratase family protein [Deltaproteobacteria bacterium]
MSSVVVGGTGFIGLNLCEALLARGEDVVSTRRKSSNTIFARRLKLPLVPADLETGEGLAEALEGRETLYFAAGHYPRYSVDTEAQVEMAVRHLRGVLEAAREAGLRRVVYVGTVSTVGKAPAGALATEEDGLTAPEEGDTYAAIKLALSEAALSANGEGLEVVELMPTGVLGPYDHKVGTGFFLLGQLSEKLDFWIEGKVNFIDARDLAEAAIAAAERGKPGERYILGGHNITVEDFVKQIADRFEVPVPARRLDLAAARALAHAEEARVLAEGKGRPLLTREMADAIGDGQFVDISRARASLGLSPRPLNETLDAAVGWYRKNGFLPRETPARRTA